MMSRYLPTLTRARNWRERVGLAVLHALRIAEGLVYLATFGVVSADWSTAWLFSDWMGDL